MIETARTSLTQVVFNNNSESLLYIIAAWIYGLGVSFGSFTFGSFIGLIWILPFFIILDTIIGIVRAFNDNEVIDSKTFIRKFAIKILTYGAIIGIGVGADYFLTVFLLNGIDLYAYISWLPFAELLTSPFTIIIYAYLIMSESWSVLENLTLVDSKIVPTPIKNAIKLLLEKFNKEKETTTEE